MFIDEDLCIHCEACIEFCPTRAIGLGDEAVRIDPQLCTECNNCLRADVCPVDAIIQGELVWPRSIRNIFSDPISVFKETGVSGRGTEESKTNDVTNRFKKGEVGFAIDMGRPNAGGVKLREVDAVSQELAKLGVAFDPDNPLTYLMTDTKTGKLKEAVLDEHVVTAIIEFKTPLEQCETIVGKLEAISQHCNTVFSVGIICRVEDDGSIPAKDILKNAGYPVRPHGKTTLDLGRSV